MILWDILTILTTLGFIAVAVFIIYEFVRHWDEIMAILNQE